jgi:hypothetical protein
MLGVLAAVVLAAGVVAGGRLSGVGSPGCGASQVLPESAASLTGNGRDKVHLSVSFLTTLDLAEARSLTQAAQVQLQAVAVGFAGAHEYDTGEEPLFDTRGHPLSDAQVQARYLADVDLQVRSARELKRHGGPSADLVLSDALASAKAANKRGMPVTGLIATGTRAQARAIAAGHKTYVVRASRCYAPDVLPPPIALHDLVRATPNQHRDTSRGTSFTSDVFALTAPRPVRRANRNQLETG